VMPAAEATTMLATSGNEGLTFIWVPQLFAQIPGGRFFQALFFLALVFAAWTSLVAMIEMASRLLMDLGVERGKAIKMVGAAGLLFGIPSALRLEFFQNQDWVWGVALMVSGFFFAFAVLRYGVTKWRETFINQEGSDIHIGAWWDWAIRLVAFEAVFLAVWFLSAARGEDFQSTWTLFSPYNVGSVVIQFAIVAGVFLMLNKEMAAAVERGDSLRSGD